jgi:hypothetical protein
MSATIVGHAADRLAARVPSGERDAILAAAESALGAARRAGVTDAAIRVHRAAGKVTCADGSNGQVAVLLVRHGEAATIMWRRLSQAHTAAAYGVKRVLCVKGTCDTAEPKGHK